jgi:sarcosine oxidase subunit delta
MEKFLFIRENKRGIIFERWRHIHGCGRYFNCVRDTVTDQIIMTYKSGEPKPSDEEIEKVILALKEEQSS